MLKFTFKPAGLHHNEKELTVQFVGSGSDEEHEDDHSERET